MRLSINTLRFDEEILKIRDKYGIENIKLFCPIELIEKQTRFIKSMSNTDFVGIYLGIKVYECKDKCYVEVK